MIFNTGKLELPSISQVHSRGLAETPWFSSHYPQRPLLSGDRLPDIHLPQSYIPPPGYSYSRAGGPAHLATATNAQFPTVQTASYSQQHPEIGLRTPSPSPTSQCSAPPGHELSEISAEHLDYSHRSQHLEPQTESTEQLSGAMNQQQQYLGSEQSHLSAGQPYQPQPSTAGAMSQYSSYQQQPPVLQPGPTNYAPAPTHYGQYGYSNGVTSPQSGGHPVSSSMGPQMNSGLLPLPSKLRHLQLSISLTNVNSNGCWGPDTTHIHWSAHGASPRLSAAKCRYKWASCAVWDEASGDSHFVGR